MSKGKKATGVDKVLVTAVFPLLLFLFALTGASQGTDLSDTMYAASNYAFFDTDVSSWHYATFLANLTGRLFFLLGGGGLFMLKLLCSLIPALTALMVYFFLRERIHPYLLFPSLLTALGLCWSPSVILYQHLSYLALTAGALLVWRGVMKRDRRFMALAGLVLGLGLFVRISNLTHCALIVYIIYDDLRYKHAKKLPGDILCCAGGYAAGAVLGLAMLFINGGAAGIGRMISWIGGLLSGEGGGGGYTMSEMMAAVADNYLGNLKFVLVAAAGVAAGSVMFALLKGKLKLIARTACLAGVVLVLIWYYRNGVFDSAYHNVGSIFRISVVVLILLLVLDIYVLTDKKFGAAEKGLALLALLTQLITPLGSNNHLYSCINNMYLLMPVGVHLFAGLVRGRGRGKSFGFPLAAMGTALVLLLLVQSVLFHLNFAFKDGTDGTKRDVKIGTEGPERLRGMKTTKESYEALKGICGAAAGKAAGSLIGYGDIPGLDYVLDLPPALSTTWPDLESYPEAQFKSELDAVDTFPLIILSREAADKTGDDADKKLLYLRDFIYNNAYERVYENEGYVLFERVSG